MSTRLEKKQIPRTSDIPMHGVSPLFHIAGGAQNGLIVLGLSLAVLLLIFIIGFNLYLYYKAFRPVPGGANEVHYTVKKLWLIGVALQLVPTIGLLVVLIPSALRTQ
jgi:hypothetical protein